jgi:hypothetical protein
MEGGQVVSDRNRENEKREFVASLRPALWPWRLPIVRHVRWAWHRFQMASHYEAWALMGMLPANADLDLAALDAIWLGDL